MKQIAERLNIEASQDPELEALEKDVRPEKVLDALEENARRITRAEEPLSGALRSLPHDGAQFLKCSPASIALLSAS